MSKLFHDMQDAARRLRNGPADSPALAELLEEVGAEAEAARQATSMRSRAVVGLKCFPSSVLFCRRMTRRLTPMARLKPIVLFEPSWFDFNP